MQLAAIEYLKKEKILAGCERIFVERNELSLFARDAHPRITSANVLYINLKITLAKFLRSTNVKQRQTLSNIKHQIGGR